ncbi:Tubulin-tyrosine ligase family [Phytophthora palmivora]|uniref:Tubulin-tyrosine ligase family n=1 Tax=Phytophthora palmivora TaxID=4796 RepID=A0A2P4XU90_9STRA|nr:Tubulin-tyrosine ligase family [Phytophthora palmivora]
MSKVEELRSLVPDEEQEDEMIQLRLQLAERDQKLQTQEITLTQATQRIETLTMQVQAAQEMAARAEQAQRDAEADYMLRHLVRDSEDELEAQAPHEELHTSHRVIELEEELTWVKDSAEVLSIELQAAKDGNSELEIKLQASKVAVNELELELQVSKDAKNEVEHQLQHELEARQKLEMNPEDDNENWKEIANVRQELVAVLTAQVKSMKTAKQKLEHAVACCQRSADHRLRVLEKDRQLIEAENRRLRGKLTRLQQGLKSMHLKLRECEEGGLNETSAIEEELERRLTRAQLHQVLLDSRIQEVERMLASSEQAAVVAKDRQLSEENYELARKLEEERCHSKQLTRSTALFKEATESALKELKNVEIELRAINRSQHSSDELHETVESLARQVVADLLEREYDQSVEAMVASMQVQYLTQVSMTQLFATDDKFADVVVELERRGWRRLPFVGCPKFDLKWTNYTKIAWTRVKPQQIVNHLHHSILFSQKDQFTELLTSDY